MLELEGLGAGRFVAEGNRTRGVGKYCHLYYFLDSAVPPRNKASAGEGNHGIKGGVLITLRVRQLSVHTSIPTQRGLSPHLSIPR